MLACFQVFLWPQFREEMTRHFHINNVIGWEMNRDAKCTTTSIKTVILILTDGYNMGQIENCEE